MTDRDLQTANSKAWQHLSASLDDPQHPFRYMTLGTVGLDGQSKARLLVLRAVMPESACLEFHTDIRSQKWRELGNDSRLTVLGFDPGRRLQLRFEGQATLFAPDRKENDQAWSGLSRWTQSTYCGGPPGDPVDVPDAGSPEMSELSDEAVSIGRQRFGVIRFQARMLDWFKLSRGNNRRAIFDYTGQGELADAIWITP